MSWPLASFLVLGVALAAGAWWYERSRPPARVLALVAAMSALAVVGRVAFAPLPNVKPTTTIVLLSGYALGGPAGFAVGAVTALASNVFFGQGPWTPWQMAAWGAVGVFGAALARLWRGREPGRWPLAAACALAGIGFGIVLDVHHWVMTAEPTLAAFALVSATSLPFNLAHALGNVVFCLLIGPPLLRALARYRRRFEVRWTRLAPGAAGRAAALALAVTLAGAVAAPPAEGASSSSRAATFLVRAQNGDGGFGADRGRSSAQLFTGWASLGLASAGRNPRDVQRGRRSAIDYMKARAGSLRDTGELERTILVARAAGLSARRFAGRNLAAELKRRQRGDGSFNGLVNLTAFGILALRAGGEPAGAGRVRDAVEWLARQQNDDGGFGFSTSSASDVDDTGAALQALAAAGRRGSDDAAQAIAYLRRAQRTDGGFGQRPGSRSNAQSTAWAVQGLVAAGRNPVRVRRSGRNPISYLRSLQRSDGAIRYSRFSAQTPVWVTAQALPALRRKAFPLAPVARASSRATAAAAVSSDSAGAAGATGGGSASPDRGGKSAAGVSRRALSSTTAPGAAAGEGGPSAGVRPRRPGPRGFDTLPADAEPAAQATGPLPADAPPPPLLALAAGAVAALALLARRRLRRRGDVAAPGPAVPPPAA